MESARLRGLEMHQVTASVLKMSLLSGKTRVEIRLNGTGVSSTPRLGKRVRDMRGGGGVF